MLYYDNYEFVIMEYLKKLPRPEHYKIGKRVILNYIPMGFDIETYTQYKKII